MKNKNKGFSLVELIVVILIMAILGVALTPQVMKWVNNSRISSDATNYDTILDACQVALTDKNAYAAVATKGEGARAVKYTLKFANAYLDSTNKLYTIVYDGDGSGADPTKTTGAFITALENTLPNYSKIQAKVSGKIYTILIYNDGTVEKGNTPETNTVN